MNYRAFGNTGVRVSELGFGCMRLAGDSLERKSEREVLYTANSVCPEAYKRNIAIVARGPLAWGALLAKDSGPQEIATELGTDAVRTALRAVLEFTVSPLDRRHEQSTTSS